MSDVDSIASAPELPPVVLETAGGRIPRATSSRLLTHGGITIPHFFAMHVTGACFPLVAGLLLYGWRAAISIGVVLITSALAVVVWRRIGARGGQLRYSHSLWLALLLALTLPPHLLTDTFRMRGENTIATWPLLPAAGLMIIPLIWLLGGLGSGRLNPVLIANLLLVALFGGLLTPHQTLQRSRIVVGDVMDFKRSEMDEPVRGRWISAPPNPGHDAVRITNLASERLIEYTSPWHAPPKQFTSLETLLRDGMPPLEDLIVGGHPGPIGISCQIAVIIGGLFMLYRGVIDHRIPLLIILSMYVAILVLPVPIEIEISGREMVRQWHWLAVRQPNVGAALGVTFANYEVMGSPLLFTAFFLATSSAIRPLARRGRTVFAILVGVLSAASQLYISVSVGPYIALLIAGVLAAGLDRFFKPRTLV
jgi:Na+-translocating ferredoxin:NAD+ oxidoreductase RnfD subunit